MDGRRVDPFWLVGALPAAGSNYLVAEFSVLGGSLMKTRLWMKGALISMCVGSVANVLFSDGCLDTVIQRILVSVAVD